jgi:hypothetical protein
MGMENSDPRSDQNFYKPDIAGMSCNLRPHIYSASVYRYKKWISAGCQVQAVKRVLAVIR